MSSYLPPPGTSDIFPDEIPRWNFIESIARKTFSLYGYGEIRTPVFEYSEVFKKSIGQETEVVQKEMYSFEDRGGRELTLRPEGTAGVMRALMETDAPNGVETRVWYLGPMFRGERPAAGRKRQFHQVGVENVGKTSPEHDVESISMLMHFLEELKISDSKLLINTRGAQEDKVPAEKALRDYFSSHIDKMCKDCKERFNKNIWRILDCKMPECQESIRLSPDVKDFFTTSSKDYFKKVTELLTKQGISYEIDNRLVRGLDYYQHTVFEVTHSGLGAQNAIAGGGRYSIAVPGSSKSISGVGFAAGVERLIMVQDSLNAKLPILKDDFIFIASLGENAREKNFLLASELRKNGLNVLMELEARSMKAQMRSADKDHVSKVLIRGDDEISKNTVIIKDMKSGNQTEVAYSEIVKYLKLS
ncbi:MAG TPA: histidine--tRNA ligase [Lentisphaeria bacterium]|nr:MAG: histidine--tRNA ligase [Lentisphaerae bacterium GWF2_38_69]HBM15697.1 histidine--tRNA ligase [Lentisphaeria bacterium]